MAKFRFLLFLSVAVGFFATGSMAHDEHIVGGHYGWQFPPNATFYQDWAKTRNFTVGDRLGEHLFLRSRGGGIEGGLRQLRAERPQGQLLFSAHRHRAARAWAALLLLRGRVALRGRPEAQHRRLRPPRSAP